MLMTPSSSKRLAFDGGLVIVPERGQGLGHCLLLSFGQSATEFPFDDLEVVGEGRIMPAAPFGRQDHPNASPIAGHGFAADQSSGLDPINEAGQSAPREERSLLELLHPQSKLSGVIELSQDVEPGQWEPGSFDEFGLGDLERP